MPPVNTHTFNRSVDETIKTALAISNQRGGEYSDSWSLENLQTPFLTNLLTNCPPTPSMVTPEFKRLVIMASMIDVKVSRLGGPWKDDTALDLINYIAAYTSLRRQHERGLTAKTGPAQMASDNQMVGGQRPAQVYPVETQSLNGQRPSLEQVAAEYYGISGKVPLHPEPLRPREYGAKLTECVNGLR